MCVCVGECFFTGSFVLVRGGGDLSVYWLYIDPFSAAFPVKGEGEN